MAGMQMDSVKRCPAAVIAEDMRDICFSTDADISGFVVLPGFADVHVHLREPGFCYKETVATGTMSAARGGYTDVCSMPNLKPVPDSPEHLDVQLECIRRDACIHVYPYGAITVNQAGEEISDLEGMAGNVCAFSDDGKGVQRDDMMREAMLRAKKFGKLIVAHCEDNSLLKGGYIHDGAYAAAHGHKGICSESEWKQIERDLALVRETGCSYHICHVSTKESVELIRKAKQEGLDVTCETGPHYLLMDDSMLREDGNYKMNPPLRGPEDRKAMLEGLLDGTVDMIATDHAPHSAEEKSRGLAGSVMGIVGLETAFPLLYTHLVKTGLLTLEKLVYLMAEAPRKRFGIKNSGLAVWDLCEKYEIDPEEFVSMGRNTPFTGWPVYGRCRMTVLDGRTVWSDGTIKLVND